MGTLKQASKILSLFNETPGDQIQALLESGFLADLRDGNIAEVKRDNFRKLLGLKSINPPLLEILGVITIAATPELVANKQFAVGGKIRYVGENFKAWFYGKTEKRALKTQLRYAKLTRSALDDEIRKEIGADLEETTLAQINALMERQKNGELGVLINNGYANIFYVRDANGDLRVVYVPWFEYGWYVLASSVTYPFRWHDDYRVFSCNSSTAVTV